MAAPRTLIVGHRSTTPDDFYGDIGSSEIRAYVANNAPADMWIRRARFRGGRIGSGTPRVRVVVYDTSGGGPAPDDIIYTFPSAYPNDRMDDANGGSLVTVNVPASQKAFDIDGGVNYALAFQVNDNDFRHNMIEAADVSGENEQFYYKSASNPPNPFGTVTPTTQGHMTLWLEGDENLPPLVPINIAPSGQVLSTTPTIEADFRDPNGAYGATAYGSVDYDAGDYLQQVRVQVRRKSDGVTFWDKTYTATSGERAANRSSIVYGTGGGATALVRGTVYQVRVQHFDKKGASSTLADCPWVDFTPGSLGVVSLTSTPTGKTNDLTPDVTFDWFHGTGLAANQAIVKFYRGNVATPVAVSTPITLSPTVASGASKTLAWSDMGISTPLPPGELHSYTVEARATDGIYSQPSAKRSFSTDAAPGVPANLSPGNGEIRSNATYPVLSAKITDADDAGGSLTAKLDILTGAGVLIGTRTASLRAGTTDTFDYQTTASDLASVGDYQHRWWAGDGYLWSGGVESEGSVTKSAPALFSWAAVPNPVITAPLSGGTVTNVQPTVTWTVTNQDAFQVRALDPVTGAVVYTSGAIPNSTARNFQIPVGWTRNGMVLNFEVGVQYLTLWGYDTETNVTIAYTPPPSLGNFQVLPSVVGLEPFPTAAVGSWDIPVTDYFESIHIFRSDIPDRPFLEIRTIGTNTFTDWHAPDGVVYTGVLNELRGLDEIVSSEPVTMAVSLPIRGVVMVSLANPQIDRYVNPSWEEIDWTPRGESSNYLTWGALAPIEKRGVADYFEGSQAFKLDSQIVDPLAARKALEALAKSTAFSYRDKYDRRFALIQEGSLKIGRVSGGSSTAFTGSLKLRGVEVTEGVSS